MKVSKSIIEFMKTEKTRHLSKALKRKKVLVVSRHLPGKHPSSIYAVLGKYIGEMCSYFGAEVEYAICPSSKRLSNRYDIGFVCYYDTHRLCRQSPIQQVPTSCDMSIYYSNLVPSARGFTRYAVSLMSYLNPECSKYEKAEYPADKKNMSRAVFAGRGVDPIVFQPNQTEFKVVVDASRGPFCRKIAKESLSIADLLNANGIKCIVLGADSKGHSVPAIRQKDVAALFGSTSVYISGIKGLYELPVLESQCAGNYVISYRDKIHRELLNPSTSFVCNTIEDVLKKVHEIKNCHNPHKPRSFIMKHFSWAGVLTRLIGEK